MSYSFLLTASSASGPDEAISHLISLSASSLDATLRFITLSSTTSTFAPGNLRSSVLLTRFISGVPCLYRPTGFSSSIPCLSVNENVDPLPYSLSTCSFPPIISRSPVTMDNPSPVPSILRLRFSSSLEKDSNSFFISSLRIPIPVSFTST